MLNTRICSNESSCQKYSKRFLVLNERSRILQRMLQGRVMQAYEFFPSRAVDSDLIITCLAVFFLLPLKSSRSSVSNTRVIQSIVGSMFFSPSLSSHSSG